jgi:purine-nucleoside phosphorylase
MDDTARALADALSLRESRPVLAIVSGSGQGALASLLEERRAVAYSAVPGLGEVSTTGHAGEAVAGLLRGQLVLVFSGRSHMYEGWERISFASTVTAALAALGVRRVLLTNSCGGIRGDLKPGCVALITDQLNLTFAGPLHISTPQRARAFPRDVYDAGMCAALRRAAVTNGQPLPEVVYAGVQGPSYETAAEIRMLARLGADVVGMSTVHEALAAREAGLKCAGLSIVTNRAGGRLSHDDVLAGAAVASRALAALVAGGGWRTAAGG